ncbi:hypothetical protein DPMN_166032 [Dreissena polymorpha]|uniref:Uncharacterized protein n=1 Tax=Dreissena polymorpha TaxID=45954 RepID=A0A9D4F0T2_DREPO|nr:hypothetical protein DPMN_166032 [Dreissena polymorpha]
MSERVVGLEKKYGRLMLVTTEYVLAQSEESYILLQNEIKRFPTIIGNTCQVSQNR